MDASPSPLPAAATADDRIFISIAAYRDAQLVPTLRSCLENARHPGRLRFGICWQHGPEESSLPYDDTERFRILDVDWRASRGACWARAEIMKLWQGEQYFLQVDSHCRFGSAWDEKLIAEFAETGTDKAILSTYAPHFTPSSDPGRRELLTGAPNLMALQSFTPEGLPLLKPVAMADWVGRKQPMRARFLAAGFLFTIGRFVQEVAYDPELYFFGEEIAMTLRAFTHGYDLFHPREALVWHDYVRTYAVRHWDDHADANKGESSRLDAHSREKVQAMLRGEPIGGFGLGTARTLADYECYAGINFAACKVQNHTRRSLEPPNPVAEPGWEEQIYPFIVRVLVDPQQMASAAFDKPLFWYVALHDEEGVEIFRRDFPGAELEMVTGKEAKVALVCEFESGIVPASWTVWPVSRSGAWLGRMEGKLAEDDYAILGGDEAADD